MYSNIEQNSIVVKDCVFESNSLIDSTSSDSSLVGGSAIYIHAQNSITMRCKFIKNSGTSSVIVDYNYDNVQSSLLKSFFKAPVLIDYCIFEIDSSSKSSISYILLSKKAVNTQVSNCIFSGKIVDGAHHIVINSNEIGSPKLNIKSCKFTCDKSKSINLNLDDHNALNSIVSFDVNNQQFHYDSKNHQNVKSNSKSLFVLSVSFIVVAVIASIAIIVVIVMKKPIDDESNDNKDPLNSTLETNDL